MRRLVLVLMIVCLAACSGADDPGGSGDVGSGSPAPVTSSTTTPTPTPTPTATPTPAVVAPLTGVPLETGDALERSVLALKIDNARRARPQVGLDRADIVIEELVEGGTTRFIALLHSQEPDIVGPVRSGREVDAELLPAFSPVVGISGAAATVHRDLATAGLLVFEEGQADGAFVRDTARRAPHNLMVRPERLWAAGRQLPPAARPWPLADTTPSGGRPAEGATTRFSHAASAAWNWDGDEWLRSQDGEEHLTAAGERITAANVVVARVDVARGGRTDSSGSPTVDIRVTGTGEAMFLRDGRVFTGQWRRGGAEQHFEWLTSDGAAFPLAPGRTWIELLPTGGELRVETPSPGGQG